MVIYLIYFGTLRLNAVPNKNGISQDFSYGINQWTMAPCKKHFRLDFGESCNVYDHLKPKQCHNIQNTCSNSIWIHREHTGVILLLLSKDRWDPEEMAMGQDANARISGMKG